MSAVDSPIDPGTSRFYYTVADYNVLLEPGIKTEILDKRKVFAIPHTPDWCLGMISLRGKLIPVANTHKLLNTSSTHSLKWLLVLEKAPFPELAICIDQLPSQQQINDETPSALTDPAMPDWLRANISINDKLFLDADHTLLFDQLVKENDKLGGRPTEAANTPNQDPSGSNA